MKKTCLFLIALACAVNFCYAQWTTLGSNIYNSNTGNVGIGTTSPAHPLDVLGTAKVTTLNVKGTTAAEVNGLTGTGMGYSPTSYPVAALGILSGGGVTSIGYDPLTNTGSNFSGDGSEVLFRNTVKFIQPNAAGTDFLSPSLTLNNGNVGIGITNPSSTLYIKGSGATGPNSSNVPLIIEDPTGTLGQNKWGIGTRIIPNSFAIQDLYNNATRFYIDGSGDIGIGATDTHGYKFAVNGSAIATSMTVQLYANWPDYVFKKDYRLPALIDVKSYIDANHRLPEMPSEQDIAKNGLNLGEMNRLLTKKVEELTLYMIQLTAENENLKKQMAEIQNKLQPKAN